MNVFLLNEADENKILIFKKNRSHYKPIDDKLKVWLALRYNVWLAEKPPWFNEKIKKLIPTELLPEISLEQHLAATAKIRKPSAFDVFLLDRESIQQAYSSRNSSEHLGIVMAKKLKKGVTYKGASERESKGEDLNSESNGEDVNSASFMGKTMEKMKKGKVGAGK